MDVKKKRRYAGKNFDYLEDVASFIYLYWVHTNTGTILCSIGLLASCDWLNSSTS